jgi:excisionase family DNA binding protein
MSTLLTIKEAAAKLKINERTLRRYIQDGKIAGYQMPGGGWRMTEEHLEGWLKKRLVKASTF